MRNGLGILVVVFVVAGFLSASVMVGAQTGSQPAVPQSGQAGSQDNPFPGEALQQNPQTPQSPQSPQTNPAKPEETTDKKPGGSSDNPFPGETTDAPIIAVDPGAGAGDGDRAGDRAADRAGRREYGTGAAPDPHRGADPDGDPMRSPDLDVRTTDDGFSSSRTGLKQMPAEDDNDGRPGKSSKNRTRSELIKEDVDVGSYYLQRKNWKAAQARFSAAFSLDGENPDAVWGLAESERHLDQFKEAADHYKLFLNYDPDGPHSKSARKALQEVESARP